LVSQYWDLSPVETITNTLALPIDNMKISFSLFFFLTKPSCLFVTGLKYIPNSSTCSNIQLWKFYFLFSSSRYLQNPKKKKKTLHIKFIYTYIIVGIFLLKKIVLVPSTQKKVHPKNNYNYIYTHISYFST
jgi:hypothetical protein